MELAARLAHHLQVVHRRAGLGQQRQGSALASNASKACALPLAQPRAVRSPARPRPG
jgi:hypothetical protein